MSTAGVLEMGGSHISSALVDSCSWTVLPGSRARLQVDPKATAPSILASLAAAARALSPADVDAWAIACPGPFDYASGVALFSGVGKFEGLYGIDMGGALRAAIPTVRPLTFINDARAFLLGEQAAGAAVNCRRAVGITLGTGIGSAFLDGPSLVTSRRDVPPGGYVYRLRYRGAPLEDTVSHRAIVRAYALRSGQDHAHAGVRAVAARARQGDAIAAEVLSAAFTALGRVIGPWLQRFDSQTTVFGGAMTGAWDLIEPALLRGLADAGASSRRLAVSADAEKSALLGAAKAALSS